MNFKLPKLSYLYNEFEPFIDKKTMEIHYTKHHQNYVNNTNNILKNINISKDYNIKQLIKNFNDIPNNYKQNLKNNLGGHINHSIFWKGLKVNTFIHGKLKEAIKYNFFNLENFKIKFKESAINHFGSGWTWLIKKEKKLIIYSTNNQDNPLMEETDSEFFGYPILGLDIWEHAYYLKYQNNRLDYINNFWNIVNWNEACLRFEKKL